MNIPKDDKQINDFMDKENRLKFVQDCIRASQDVVKQYRPKWDKILRQIRCVHPDEWDKKEDWQTRCYYPLQSKGSESATSNHNQISFPADFFDIIGFGPEDKEKALELKRLYKNFMETGQFFFNNDLAIEEGVDIGTAWMKILARPDGMGFNFFYRSSYVCSVDPSCGPNMQDARYWVDHMQKDIVWLMDQVRAKNPRGVIYDKEAIRAFLKTIKEEGDMLKGGERTGGTAPISGPANTPQGTMSVKDLVTIKDVDGITDISIPKIYQSLNVDEFWGIVPKYERDKNGCIIDVKSEWRVITVINERWIIRDDVNEYGDIPAIPLIVKKRRHTIYGKGYFANTIDLQDLVNTLINLGMDSQKISSMDIALVDESKVADSSSIEMRPLAIWKMNNISGAKINRSGASAIRDILMGITLIDSIFQDATGVTRMAEGTPTVEGGQAGEETLGQSQMKMAAVSKRFMEIAKFIEQSYVKPLLKKIFNYTVNPKLFSQEACNRILGVEIEQIPVPDPFNPSMPLMDMQTGQPVMAQKEIPKLDLKELAKIKEMGLDFNPTGVQQFNEKMEMLGKLRETLTVALQDPTIRAFTKIYDLWKKVLQLANIPDYEDFLKTPDEIEQMKQQIMGQLGGGMPGGMGGEGEIDMLMQAIMQGQGQGGGQGMLPAPPGMM
jgi:hypothetical protein